MASVSGEKSNRNSRKSGDQPITTLIQRLPREIYLNILSRQPIASLLQCKLVSQHWYSSIKDPLLAEMHLKRATEDDLCLIIFHDWPKSKLQLIQLCGEEGPTGVKELKTPFDESELPDFEVIGSCNGLVCLYNIIFDDPLFIYNPFTIEYRQLPKLEISSQAEVCRVVFGFGFHPKTTEYKVMKIVYYKLGTNDFVSNFLGGNPEAFVLSFGNSTWRNIGKIPYDVTGPTSEAEVNGKLHWLSLIFQEGDVGYREIISFDLETEEFQVVLRPSSGCLNRTDYHLATLQDYLSAIVACDGLNEIWMMKEYGVEASWTKQYIILNYVPPDIRISMMPPFRRKKNGYLGRAFRVLCILKNGEILFLHRNRSLVSYNPDNGEFNDLNFQGLPLNLGAFVLQGSLVSVNTVCGNAEMRTNALEF